MNDGADGADRTAGADGIEEPGVPVDRPAPSTSPYRLVLGALAVLVALTGWLGWRDLEVRRAEDLRAAMVQAGQAGVVALTTIDHERVDEDVRRILDSSTGGFRDDFARRADSFADAARQAQSTSVGTVSEAGVESVDGEQGRVLINAGLKIPDLRFRAVCDIWPYHRTYAERLLKKFRHDARPFDDPQDRPRVAIVVYRLGLSQEETEAAIRHLPGEVTLAFSPYSRRLAEWISAAAAAGHEALIQVPMEPIDYPADDPGPLTLLTAATARDNMERLSAVLERASGTFGAMNHMGSRFTASPLHMRTVIEALATRGLAWVDARDSADTLGPRIATDAGVPTAYVNRVIDLQASRVSIDQRLAELERIARADGAAVGAAYPFPVTIERLGAWVNTLEAKGLVLAPVSAVLNRQRVP